METNQHESAIPAEASAQSRRDILQKAAIGGVTIWSAPLILTGTAGAQAGTTPCEPCEVFQVVAPVKINEESCYFPFSIDREGCCDPISNFEIVGLRYCSTAARTLTVQLGTPPPPAPPTEGIIVGWDCTQSGPLDLYIEVEANFTCSGVELSCCQQLAGQVGVPPDFPDPCDPDAVLLVDPGHPQECESTFFPCTPVQVIP